MAGGHDSAGGLRWLLTYADMITLLTVFFVVLYSMAKGDVSKYQILSETFDRAFQLGVFRGFNPTTPEGVGGAPGTPLRAEDFSVLAKPAEDLARDLGFAEVLRVGQRREGVVLSLSGNLLFSSGTAELRPEGRQVLARVADVLRPLPNRLRIEGHTDDIPFSSPQYASNWELSAARALAVLNYLRAEGGIAAERLTYAAFGENRPTAPNETREGRQRNRRADIVVLHPPQDVAGGRPSPAPLIVPSLAPSLAPEATSAP
ncbi:MAG: OmpA family protein [Chloroflexi bacterium]|nr:OmpA family protein [Chloroflexota bacterium]